MHDHAQAHSHAPGHPRVPLPLSLLAQSAAARVAGVSGLLAVLWLAIAWAIAKP